MSFYSLSWESSENAQFSTPYEAAHARHVVREEQLCRETHRQESGLVHWRRGPFWRLLRLREDPFMQGLGFELFGSERHLCSMIDMFLFEIVMSFINSVWVLCVNVTCLSWRLPLMRKAPKDLVLSSSSLRRQQTERWRSSMGNFFTSVKCKPSVIY